METIKQIIERRADKYTKILRNKGYSVNSVIGAYNSYIQDATDQQAIFDNLPRIKAWIARDKNEEIYIHYMYKPTKYYERCWNNRLECHYLAEDQLPKGCNPKWEDEEPIEVELIIKMINQ